jgi:hypothetical protein
MTIRTNKRRQFTTGKSLGPIKSIRKQISSRRSVAAAAAADLLDQQILKIIERGIIIKEDFKECP